MTEKKSTITYADLPDAITPLDYADWMGRRKVRKDGLVKYRLD